MATGAGLRTARLWADDDVLEPFAGVADVATLISDHIAADRMPLGVGFADHDCRQARPLGAVTILMWFVAALLGIWLRTGEAQEFDPKNPGASGYVQTFVDDFHAVDLSVWEEDWWYDISSETACQKDFLPGTALASADGLTLHIESLEKLPACKDVARYSNAQMDSHAKFSQQFGYFEARIKPSATRGTVTAFWLLPESGGWPPEVDVEEIRGDFPKIAYMTNHTGRDNAQKQFPFTAPSELGGAYQTYGVLLTANTISWYIDGVLRGQTSQGFDESTPVFVVLSLATGKCGDGWAGCPEKSSDWSADALVRWIRVWRAPSS